MNISLLDFIRNFTDDKTLITVQDDDNYEVIYKGRSEFLRNDYGERYPKAYNSKLSGIDNCSENTVLIYVEVV